MTTIVVLPRQNDVVDEKAPSFAPPRELGDPRDEEIRRQSDVIQRQVDEIRRLTAENEALRARLSAIEPTEGTPEGLSNAQAAQLQAWVGGHSSPSAWTEVYRASRDGFGADAFHTGCDGKPRLLILVREKTNGWLFGGFTEVGFITGSDRRYADPAAFLFSLTNPAGCPERLASKGGSDEVRYCSGDLACFGGGWVADMHIVAQADSNRRSWTRPGTSFEASSARGWHPMAAGWQRVYWSASEVVAWTVLV